MKTTTQIHSRVQVVEYDGQAPHPMRRHFVVVVDGKAVWHRCATALTSFEQMRKLASHIARTEIGMLARDNRNEKT